MKNTKKKIRIGILGCANIARRSMIPAIKQLPDLFELTCIASRSLHKAESFTNEFGGIPVSSYEEMINREDIDAIYIPLPTGLHKEYVNKALVAGKHVYVEKSIAMNFSDAKEMVETAKDKNLAIMEGFMFQYHTQHTIVKNLLKQGAIGDIRYFSANFCFPPLDKNNFRYSEKIGGGVLMDAAGYPLRATHFLLGDDFEVKASTLKFDDDYATYIYGSAFLTNNEGIGASISFGFDNFYQCNYEIIGQKGKITATRAYTPSPTFDPEIIIETPEGKKIINAGKDNHFIHAMSEFHRTISNASSRKKHYSEILLQSSSLSLIRKYSQIAHE